MSIRTTKRHALGQHFLISQSVCEKIVRAASLNENDLVMEIGTGMGALTEKIAPCVQRVISYEKDHNLFLKARDKFLNLENVSLIQGDALDPTQEYIPFNVCITSLPYSRSRDFIHWLSTRSGSFRLALAVLQLDFARKLRAKPHDFNYKSVSVIAQISFLMKEIGTVDRASFQPPPKVESVIVKFEPNDKFVQPFLNLKRISTLKKFFSFKGRKLRNALKSIDAQGELDLSNSVLKSKRIEELSPEEFASILENIC